MTMTMHDNLDRPPAPVVSFNDVHMVFTGKLKKPVYALRGMSLDIQAGSIVGLLGPNGCGKTTAVACLLGLLFPQQGQLRLWGKPARQVVSNGKKYQIGVVLEDTRLPPFMTVKGALAAVCNLRSLSGEAAEAEMARVVETTRITPLLDYRINGLSKGQARRVGVAAALIGDPPLLVMDEPASGLDVSARIDFNDLVRSLGDGRRTLVITSHLLSDVENTCTHIAIMQSGRVTVFDKISRLVSSDDDDAIDIFIHEKHRDELIRLALPHAPCIYPRLVRIDMRDRTAHAVIGLLFEKGIVPRRIEPRRDLIRYYISLTETEARP